MDVIESLATGAKFRKLVFLVCKILAMFGWFILQRYKYDVDLSSMEYQMKHILYMKYKVV